MSRTLYFILILLATIGVVLIFSMPPSENGKRDWRKLARRAAVLLGFFVLFTGVGWGALRLSRQTFGQGAGGGPGFGGGPFGPRFGAFRRNREPSSIPWGLPAVALTSLLCGITVLWQYRRQEKLADKLAQSERSRTLLLKDLAHDVRSPMTALRLIMDGLRLDHASGTELIDRTDTAIRELGYLQGLIDSLLLLAQLEDPDFAKETSEIALGEMVEEMIGQFQDFPDRLHLDWHFQRAPQSDVVGNRVLLDRALRNAFENASRFARTRVEVRMEAASDALVLTVRDDGPGFSAGALTAFGKRRTLRLVDTSAPSTQSLGLGSAILCSSIERLGGQVTVANHPQGGAEVTIRLPHRRRAQVA